MAKAASSLFVLTLLLSLFTRNAEAKLKYYSLSTGKGSVYDMSSGNILWQGSGPNYTGEGRPYGYETWTGTPFDFNSGVINLPFAFKFNGTSYSQAVIYTAGIITLGSGTMYSSYNNQIGNCSMPTIAAFWDDLHYTGTGGGCWSPDVSYATFGNAPNRVFVVEWHDMEIGYGNYYGSLYGWGNRGTFQAQLFEDGTITFYYSKMEWKSSCGGWQGYENYGMQNGVSGSIGLGQSSTDFLSVTPGGTPSTSTTTAKDNIDLDKVPITGGTSYTFVKQPEVRLSATPKTVDYGTLSGGTSATGNIIIKHVGIEGTLNILSTSMSGTGTQFFTITKVPGALNPGQSDTLKVKFAPTQNGTYNTTLTINTNGVDSGTQQILLTGSCVAPTIQIIPIGDTNTAVRMFKKTRTRLRDSLRQSFLIRNTGAGALAIDPLTSIIGDYPAMYTISRRPLFAISGGLADTMSITFRPTEEGSRPAKLNLVSNASNGTQQIDLFGTGVLPRVELSPAGAMTIDSVPMGTTVCRTITITNNGSDSLWIKQTYLSSADGDFTLTPLTTYTQTHVSGMNTLTNSRTVQLCFTPMQKGTRRARFRVTTDIPLTFDQPPQDTSFEELEIWANAIPSDRSSITFKQFDDAVMGTDNVSTLTFKNEGSEVLTISSPFFSGADPSEFTVTKAIFPLDVQPGQSVSFDIDAKPLVHGANSATIHIPILSDDGNSFLQTEDLSINGLAVCSNTSSASLEFSKLYLGENETKTFDITNCGDISATYTASIEGGGFAIDGNTTIGPIAAGEKTTVNVKFAPLTKGSVTSTLRIKSAYISDLTVSLSGEGEEKPTTDGISNVTAQDGFSLTQNHPNPATGNTTFSFTTPEEASVNIVLVDITGKTIRQLASGKYATGTYEIKVNSNDLASGTYIYVLESGAIRLTRQMVVGK
jgi:hypothetical protein